MIKTKFDQEKLQQYVNLLQKIVKISIAVYDVQMSPIIETDAAGDPAARAENIRKRLSEGKDEPAIWFAPDRTAEIAAPVFYENLLFAYVWIGNFYFQENANPHNHSVRYNRPVYDQQSIHDIIGLVKGGVQLFLRDICEIDPGLQDKIDKYIEANPVKKITLSTLGSALHTDTEVLRIFFAENLKCKLPEYLRKKKVGIARRLLAETDLSLPEVCEKVGLTEEQLTRLVVKSESVTPEQFRQNHRK